LSASPLVFVNYLRWINGLPSHWQLEGCAQRTFRFRRNRPNVGQCLAHRPPTLPFPAYRRWKVLQFGLTSETVHTRVWARYQRQLHPSQIFNCTRNSMTVSPYPKQFRTSFAVGCTAG
jgi:hypothetical protein